MTGQQLSESSTPAATEGTTGLTSRDGPEQSDIPEHKQMEDALRASEERLRLLIESATDYAIFTMDPAGYINSWNTGAERIFGWTVEEVIGQPGALIFTPEDRAAGVPEREMKSARETGRALDERFHLRKDGSRFYVSGSMSPLYQHGHLAGYVKIARDLTERKRMEEELEKRVRERTRELRQSEAQLRLMASRLTMAEQMERRRLSQILHDDLQQLLYGIQLKIEFISQDATSGEPERLRSHAAEAAAWIEDAITMTRRLTVDLSPPVLQGEGLTAGLGWLVTQMKELHSLQVKLEADQPFLIDADMRVLLFQIVRELLFNVVKHADTGHATVALHEEAGRLVIQVSDKGRGFEVGSVVTGQEEGFGLLSIRERLGLFGGRLEIISQPGAGTQITVYIPLKLENSNKS